MERLQKLPGISWAINHPRISAWVVLSVGMVVLLVIEAREVGLLPTQWLALIVACVLVAGACVWIISWEGDDETDADDAAAPKTDAPAETKPEAEKPSA
jgi:hypothetical protein